MGRTLLAQTEEDTAFVGARLAKLLHAPAFVALYGELGAGKTALARGFGAALGADDVSSPTFTIVREYDTQPRLLHFDAYRLSGADELMAIGFSDYLNEPALIVLEWAELVEEALPEERLDIHIAGSGDEPRSITLVSHGAAYESVVKAL